MPQPPSSDIFFELFMPCQQQIYTYLFMLVHNESDAEDLLQETAKSLWQHFDQYDSEKNFLAWAVTIARNQAISFLRKNARSKAIFKQKTYQLIAEMRVEDDGDRDEREQRFLKECLKKLKPVDRKILYLKYEEGISARSIAAMFGRSKTGIYQTVARIHGMLYRCVQKYMAMEEYANG